MESIFKKKKISATPFRNEVLAIFNKYNSAIPLSIIEDELKSHNRITLYRTIKIFLEKGIIHEINLNGESSNYALCKEECGDNHNHQHIHFKCSICSQVTCVDIDRFPKITLPNFKIGQLEIQATGLCKKCNN